MLINIQIGSHRTVAGRALSENIHPPSLFRFFQGGEPFFVTRSAELLLNAGQLRQQFRDFLLNLLRRVIGV